jgi:phospholipid transport system transporter-binding protein
VIRVAADTLLLEGAVNLGTVSGLLAKGAAHLRAGASVVDFSAASQIDSSALALILEWMRQAKALGGSLRLVNAPPSLLNLAELYGLEHILTSERR